MSFGHHTITILIAIAMFPEESKLSECSGQCAKGHRGAASKDSRLISVWKAQNLLCLVIDSEQHLTGTHIPNMDQCNAATAFPTSRDVSVQKMHGTHL
jgi:hypothetical protein